jgi:hypothetical protein
MCQPHCTEVGWAPAEGQILDVVFPFVLEISNRKEMACMVVQVPLGMEGPVLWHRLGIGDTPVEDVTASWPWDGVLRSNSAIPGKFKAKLASPSC